jgi:VanZ family protein
MVKLTRRGAWLAMLCIIVLSVAPGNMRPSIFDNDYAEHFVAYFIAGSLFAMGYLRSMQLLASGFFLTFCAASLEFVQLWIPGRTASVSDFAAGTIGVWIGFLVVVAVRRACEQFVVS